MRYYISHDLPQNTDAIKVTKQHLAEKRGSGDKSDIKLILPICILGIRSLLFTKRKTDIFFKQKMYEIFLIHIFWSELHVFSTMLSSF